MTLWEQVQEMVREHIPNKNMAAEVSITPDTRLFEDLQYDSVAVIEFLADIEERFGVDYTDLPDFIEKMNRCGDFCQGIEELCRRNL